MSLIELWHLHPWLAFLMTICGTIVLLSLIAALTTTRDIEPYLDDSPED